MVTKAVLLYSGGLDSTLAGLIVAHLGIKIFAFHLKTPFCQCPKLKSLPMELEQFRKEFAGLDYVKEVVFNPKYGYGQGLNPCVDCRIYLFSKAKEFFKEVNADFFVTGEVLNQRPMSQKLHQLKIIEKEAGVTGLVLRPLSAKLLEPTLPEKEGLIDRNKLLAISGRSRKEQIRLLKEFGIQEVPPVSCGCLLVNKDFANRLKDFRKHLTSLNDFDLRDIEIIKIGRHFRIKGIKVVIGRNKKENEMLAKLVEKKNYNILIPENFNGPTAIFESGLDSKQVIDLVSAYSKTTPPTISFIFQKEGETPKKITFSLAQKPERVEYTSFRI